MPLPSRSTRPLSLSPSASRLPSLVGLVGLAALAALSAVGCSSSSDGGGGKNDVGASPAPGALPAAKPFAPDEARFDVKWKPEAKVIADAKSKLLSESEGGGNFVYRFRPDADDIAALLPDEVAVLGGVAYRKVVSVEKLADAVVLTTKRTKLTEAIAEGNVDWKQTFDFGNPSTIEKASFGVGPGALRPLDITTGLSWDGDVEGFAVSVSLTPSNGRLNISVTASKEIAGEKRFALSGEGFIERFQSEGHMVFDPSGLVDFRTGSNQVRGEVKIKAAAFNAGVSQNLLNLPLRVQIPMNIGPVPVLVKLGANVNVTAALSAEPASAEAEVTIGFSSDQGVQLSGTSLTATGSLGGEQLTVQGGGSSSAVAAGMTVCLEAPRVELAFLGELASVGLTQNNCASTVYTFDPACNEVNASIVGKGLGQLGFFGITLASAEVELYSKRDGRSVGNCGPRE